MNNLDISELKKIYTPSPDSHKGQNGKLLVIGGSHLFHAASLWALKVASKIVDMVFYSSVPENTLIVQEMKREFRDGIIVPRDDLERYASEADVILIGPGMLRDDCATNRLQDLTPQSLSEVYAKRTEGEQSYYLTKYLLTKYPDKKWIIDAGALQMMNPDWLLPIEGRVVLTPHQGEFDRVSLKIDNQKLRKSLESKSLIGRVEFFAKEYNCIVLLKGKEDVACSPERCIKILGGNAGMTKGGTGDVLAGLIAALACNNDLWLATICGSYINKKAGDSLFEKVGYYYNSSDLADEIPRIIRKLLK